MYTKMTCLFWLRPDTTTAKGITLYCRVTIAGHRVEVSTGVKLLPKDWCQERQKVRGHSEAATDLNKRILQIRNGLAQIAMNTNLPPDRNTIRASIKDSSGYFKGDKRTFADYCASWMLQKQSNYEPGTIRSLKARIVALDRVLEKHPRTPLCMLGRDFWQMVIDELANAHAASYVKKIWQLIQQIYAHAAKDSSINTAWMAEVLLPMAKDKEIIHLSKIEVDRWSCATMPSKRLEQVQDLFLFQCYTGLAVADLQQVKPGSVKMIGAHWFLCYQRQKTKKRTDKVLQVPMLATAYHIWQKYGGQLPKISDQKYNAYLKEVAEHVGIKKTISSHVGRKTCATLLYEAGVSMDAVKDILGHMDEATTRKHYAKVTADRLAGAMSGLGLASS